MTSIGHIYMKTRSYTTIKIKCRADLMPTRAHTTDAGYDLRAVEGVTLLPGNYAVIKTGVSLELPPGWEAQVRGRSGLATRGIFAHLGTIDSGYRGEIAVILLNIGGKGWVVKAGDRIGQLVFSKVPETELVRVDELGDSDRGSAGFGSTGRA